MPFPWVKKSSGPNAAAALAAALALAACGTRGTRRMPDAGVIRRSATSLAVTDGSMIGADPDAAAPTETIGPLPPALAACIERNRAAVPPELAQALDALQLQSALIESGCRVQQAVAFSDPSLCERVSVRALRTTCFARAAVAAGRPEICPPAELERGRDPACVALASRSVGLCAATLWGDRPRCLAVARKNPGECDALDELLRPRCRDDVGALRAALPALEGRPLAPAQVQLAFGAPDAGVDAGPPRAVVIGMERGAFVDPNGTLYILDPMVGWPADDIAWSRAGALRLGLALRGPARAGRGRLVALRLVMPDGRLLLADVEHPGARADVTFRRAGTDRGASVSGVATVLVRPRNAEMPDAPPTDPPVSVEISFHTFVRDVIDPGPLGVPPQIVPPPAADE